MRLQTRKKIAKAVKAYWRKVKREKGYREREARRRNRIRKALKLWHRTHVTASERRWGAKIVKEQKKERRRVKVPLELSPKERARVFLEQVAKQAPGDTSVDAVTMADGSAEAELRIAIPRGVDGKDMLLELASHIVLPQSMWVSFGWIFSKGVMSDTEIEDYERFHRMLQVHTHYRKTIQSKIQGGILGAMRIYDALESNKRRKPEQFYIRLHWSPDGKRPE